MLKGHECNADPKTTKIHDSHMPYQSVILFRIFRKIKFFLTNHWVSYAHTDLWLFAVLMRFCIFAYNVIVNWYWHSRNQT